MMSIQEKIVDQLKDFSEIELQEILKFADFLLWQRSKQEVASPSDETANSESANIGEEALVHYVGGFLVVKAVLSQTEKMMNWNTIVNDMRAERMEKFI